MASHVLQAARSPVELDEFQANAVAARIELDLRIGAAFTRLQTLQLQAVAAILKEKVISYGRSFAFVEHQSIVSNSKTRLLSVSYAWIRRGSVLSRKELQARDVLEYQGYA